MRSLASIVAGTALLALVAGPARAQVPGNTVTVGILSDMSGPFADQSGKGAVVAAEMAAADFAPEAGALKVRIVSADHQNKPDVGAGIVRRWIDEQGVDAVADAVNSAVALAVNTIIAAKHRTFLATNTGTSDLTGKYCEPTTVQWNFDTWAMGNAAAHTMMRQGGNSWYFVSFDYAFGKALERDAAAALERLGGQVLGHVYHPLGTTDFSSYLLQAQASGAKVLAFGDTGNDLVNAVKQANEFGLTKRQKLVALFVTIADIQAMGLKEAQGLTVTESFYWNRNDASRAFSRRFAARMDGKMPTANQASVYSQVLAYLRAVKAADSIVGEKVVAEMRRAPIKDDLLGTITVRPDGRAVHPLYVFRVKTPSESHKAWDDYTQIGTIPASQAFRPLQQGGCKLVHS